MGLEGHPRRRCSKGGGGKNKLLDDEVKAIRPRFKKKGVHKKVGMHAALRRGEQEARGATFKFYKDKKTGRCLGEEVEEP